MAWNGSDHTAKTTRVQAKSAPSVGRGIAAGAIVVIIVAGIVYFLLPSEIKQAVPTGESRPKLIEQVEVVKPEAEEESPKTEKERTVFDIIRERGGRQNLTEEDKEEIRRIQKENMSKISAPSPTVQTPFKHNSDQVIAMAMTAGDSVPPLPGTDQMLNDSFVNSLLDPIVIEEGDDERTRQIKETVRDVRKEIAERVKEGKSVREVLEEHRREMNSYSELKREAWKIAKELVDAGDIETADEFVRRANEKLEAVGMTVNRPLTEDEARERLRERRAERLNKAQN